MELYQKLSHWATSDSSRIAFHSNNQSLTYKDLEEHSNALSTWIDTQLGADTSPVVVYGHMETDMLTSFLAVVKSGRAYIPIDSTTPEDRIQKILNHAQPKLIISLTPFSDSLVGEEMLSVNQERLNTIYKEHKGHSLPLSQAVQGDENFYIIFTSGSTGNPKGVQISYNNLMSFVSWIATDFSLSEEQTFINQAPFSFDLSVMDTYPCLFLGGKLWGITKEMVINPKQLFESLKESNLEVWTSTPSFADMCLNDAQFSQDTLKTVKTFLFCGEALAHETATKLLERFPQATIYNTYGPTEATVAVTEIKVDSRVLESYPSLPIGRIKGDSDLAIVNDNYERVTKGEKGQLLIIGPSVSTGYYKQDDLSKNSFITFEGKPAYKTGDIGYEENGLFFYSGRMDFQVKINGFRMEIEDIEAQLRSVSLVDNAVVLPIMSDGKCQYLTSVTVVHPHDFEKEFKLTSAIKKELNEKLPTYMIPRKFVYVSSLPMTNNGKIDRKRIASEVLS